MQAAFLSAFAIACLLGVLRPAFAFVLVLLMHPLEQVLQAHCPILVSTALGASAVNYAVGFTSILACTHLLIRRPGILRRAVSPSTACILALLAWAAISLLWSPGRADGLEMLQENLPYVVLVVMLAPILLGDVNDLRTAHGGILLLGVILCAFVAFSPAFTSRYGRIGFAFAGGARSNPLAIGELGGTVLLVAATIRGVHLLGIPLLPLRLLAVILGAIVAVKSGSRGQLAFSVVVAVAFVPIAAPIRNVGAFISSAVLVGVVAYAVDFMLTTELQGFDARRFSANELLYGDSSASGRLRNVIILFKEWASSPTALFIGLGYSAFSALPGSAFEMYSHVMFADALFELGIPGLALSAAALLLAARSGFGLFRTHRHQPAERASVAILCALLCYHILLVNKQGAIWGIPIYFAILGVMNRLWLRCRDTEDDATLLYEDDDAPARELDFPENALPSPGLPRTGEQSPAA
jgi:hypothetical protein